MAGNFPYRNDELKLQSRMERGLQAPCDENRTEHIRFLEASCTIAFDFPFAFSIPLSALI